MKHIAVVEDEDMMREELEAILQKAGYRTSGITDFENAAAAILAASPDLVLLDLNLPGMLQDELHALDLGADEFLTKPCRKERLLARVSNVLKRYEGRNNLLEGNGFLLDRQTYTLYIHNQSVILPQNQGKILEIFLEHGSDIVTKEELCIALWGTAEFIDENALQVNLTRLKKTMANLDMPQQILPVRGVGYRFVGQTAER